MQGIPKKIALRLCEEIHNEKRKKWYTFSGLQCWRCYKFNKGKIAKMHVGKKPGNRGCDLINRLYEN